MNSTPRSSTGRSRYPANDPQLTTCSRVRRNCPRRTAVPAPGSGIFALLRDVAVPGDCGAFGAPCGELLVPGGQRGDPLGG